MPILQSKLQTSNRLALRYTNARGRTFIIQHGDDDDAVGHMFKTLCKIRDEDERLVQVMECVVSMKPKTEVKTTVCLVMCFSSVTHIECVST